MADLRISDLTQVANLNNGDFVEVSQENSQAQTGYTSMKANMTDLGNKFANSLQFTSALQTTAKTIIGAINELFSRGLSDLPDTDIQSATSGQVFAYDGSKWANSDILNTKADVIPTGSHTVYGIWGNTFYGTCRMWVAFPNANKYTITLTSAKYRSADTTMTSLSSATIAVTNDCGFLVSSGNNVPINQYGEVTFTTA